MKTTTIVLALFSMMLIAGGNAAADFNYGANSSLGLSIYNPETGMETGYDLGVIGTELDLSAQNITLTNVDASDTNATVALYSATGSFQFFFGLTTTTAPALGKGVVSFQGAVRDIFNIGYVNGQSPVTVAAAEPKTANSIFKDFGNYQGAVQGGNPAWQPSLTPLGEKDYVDIYLYRFDGPTLNKGFHPSTDYTATVRIQKNGTVVLNPPVVNQPPTIDNATATPNPADEGATVTLSASASDPDGEPLTYQWSTTAVVTGFPKSGEQVTFDAPAVDADTQISFTLSVSDGTDTVTDTVNVSITDAGGGNSAPIIDSATATPNPADEGATVTLSASASDPDGEPLTYQWSTSAHVTGFPKSGAQVSFEAPAVDVDTQITFTLSVSDASNADVTDSVTVSVTDTGGGNSAPSINSVTASPNPANEGATVTLSASASDPDGEPLTYQWSTSAHVTGFPKSGAQVSFEAPAVDADTQIAFTLSVSDANNADVTESVTVAITDMGAGNLPPVADVGGSQFEQAGDTVTLDGSGSSDPDGQIVSYQWQQSAQDAVRVEIIDDDPADGLARFVIPGNAPLFTVLTFVLTVTDIDGASDSSSGQVFVVSENYIPPEADAGPDQTVWEDGEVTLDGSGSTIGDFISYQWRQISGPVNVELKAITAFASFTAPQISTASETFVFELAVSDPTGFAALDTVTITVKKNLPPDAPPSSALTPLDAKGVWESSEWTPLLTVNNTPPDPDGDSLTYEFEIFNADNAIPVNFVFGADGVPEGPNTTSWRPPALDENTHYFWRVRVSDGFSSGPWMDSAEIFINAQEENPAVPAISAPADGTSVDALKPTLEVTNATDPDEDPLTYEFRIYENRADPVYAFIQQKTDVTEGTQGATQWTVESDLTENQFYWWRVRAADDTGLTGDWTDAAMFLVDTANDAPEPPVVVYPENDSEIDTPDPLFRIEGGLDPEGDPVDFYVELDTENTFTSQNWIQSGALEVTDPLTTWRASQSLDENTTYYYRVKASDGDAESAWRTGSLFVNQFNEPPGTPDNAVPTNKQLVTTLSPTLKASSVADPDNDAVRYVFELFLAGNLTDPIATVSDNQTSEWVVPSTNLSNGKKYLWHVWAVDEHGEAGQLSAMTEFTIGANNFQPSTPVKVSPFDGGTVNSLTPTLSVVATDDGDGLDVWVEFELYQDSGVSDLVSFSLVPRGITATSWQVDDTLTDLGQYFWRARTTDGEKHSAWTTLANFIVDLSGQNNATVRVWKTSNYDPVVPWYTIVEVDDADSAIQGAKVIMSPGVLGTTETIYIGEAEGAPGFSQGLNPFSNVVEFGPSGTRFNVPVTIKVPYHGQDLAQAGTISAHDLSIYTYNEADGRWEMVDTTAVDEVAQLLVCQVDHFSMFAAVADTGSAADSSAAASGGGGGGCFIGIAETSLLHGELGWMAVPMVTICLLAWKAGRRKQVAGLPFEKQ